MLAKYNYIALLGMHEVLIAVRSNLVHESSRCEPNKRGVSQEVAWPQKIRGASAPLIFRFENPSLQSLATPLLAALFWLL